MQDAERVGDHPRVQHVGNRDRRLHGGAGILCRPFALHHRDHRDLLMGNAVRFHVAQHRDRKHARGCRDTVRQLELSVQAVGAHHAWRTADVRLAAFGMCDQHGLAQPGFDRGRGMADMQHEGAAAHRGAIDPCRRDAEIMRNLLRRLDRGGKAVDVGQFQPGVRDRVQRGIRMQLDLRCIGNNAELGGLGRADDGNLVPAHSL